ncbi:MAG: DUF805 domain-containing protein [Clostridia bacterium]|nr:DUF805 domain-containing protein [Clostridia bacterium]
MLSYIKAMGKYADFGGRSSRREFWGFLITNSVLWGVIIYLLRRFPDGVENNVMIAVAVMYFALTIVPSVAIIFRRWHDLGRTGAWVLLNLVPGIGTIVTLCFFLCKGDGFNNRYGADPDSNKKNKKYRR